MSVRGDPSQHHVSPTALCCPCWYHDFPPVSFPPARPKPIVSCPKHCSLPLPGPAGCVPPPCRGPGHSPGLCGTAAGWWAVGGLLLTPCGSPHPQPGGSPGAGQHAQGPLCAPAWAAPKLTTAGPGSRQLRFEAGSAGAGGAAWTRGVPAGREVGWGVPGVPLAPNAVGVGVGRCSCRGTRQRLAQGTVPVGEDGAGGEVIWE